jgi:hypothetical protein
MEGNFVGGVRKIIPKKAEDCKSHGKQRRQDYIRENGGPKDVSSGFVL